MTNAPVGQVLDWVLEGRAVEAGAAVTAALASEPSPAEVARYASVGAFNLILRGDHLAAYDLANSAATAVPLGVFGSAALTFARCMLPLAPGDPDLPELYEDVWALRGEYLELSGENRAVAGYLAVECAMSSGRLVEAEQLARALLDEPGSGSVQSVIFVGIALARSLAFQGRVAEAAAAASVALVAAEENGAIPARMLAGATSAYIAAQTGSRAEAERLTATVIALEPEPDSYITVGSHVLAAYGLGAVDGVEQAARIILHAAGGPGLPRLQTVDRAYAYEILATDAIDRNDLAAARSWGRRSAPLSIHNMAAAAVERTLSRIDAATGDYASAAERAAVSAARASVSGGNLDAARADVLAARALAIGGSRSEAINSLMEAAALAEKLGATTVRQWASTELRKLGRRLAPVAGAGWDALSKREQQITLLAAEGYSNRSIATALYLSERTVQSHLSRTLVALGVSSRAAIPASLWPASPPDFALFQLTRRQQEVAMLVIDGHPNRIIASTLNISEKTVEKHIQGMFERLGVSSRTGIANRLLASGDAARV